MLSSKVNLSEESVVCTLAKYTSKVILPGFETKDRPRQMSKTGISCCPVISLILQIGIGLIVL